jgi:hypothetical protein
MKKCTTLCVVFPLIAFSCTALGMQKSKNSLSCSKFIIPSTAPKLHTIVHNTWYREVPTIDETTRSFKRIIPLGPDQEVIKLTFNAKGTLQEYSINYKANNFCSDKSTVVWTITKKRFKEKQYHALVKSGLAVVGLMFFMYIFCKGPLYTHVA